MRSTSIGGTTLLSLLVLTWISTATAAQQGDPLPSWNPGSAKSAITAFVAAVTARDKQSYVPAAERIAVFDNDGTLWSEQPMYAQLAFVLDRVRELAHRHPDWKHRQPFKAALENDLATLAASGEAALVELVAGTHAGMTSEEFTQVVERWIQTARHPKTKRPYTEMVFQPMLELLAYLRANEFEIYIVSGGGVEFMRPWAQAVYGIPPQRVIGSSIKLKFELQEGRPVLRRLPEINFVDDKEGKPVGIQQFIGRRPIAAFGNSDGDLQMLQWTVAQSQPVLAVLIHHTDAEREFAYDRQSPFGRLDRALDEARARNWVVVDMKQDWRVIFSPGR
jgi:hypothetical protein